MSTNGGRVSINGGKPVEDTGVFHVCRPLRFVSHRQPTAAGKAERNAYRHGPWSSR